MYKNTKIDIDIYVTASLNVFDTKGKYSVGSSTWNIEDAMGNRCSTRVISAPSG